MKILALAFSLLVSCAYGNLDWEGVKHQWNERENSLSEEFKSRKRVVTMDFNKFMDERLDKKKINVSSLFEELSKSGEDSFRELMVQYFVRWSVENDEPFMLMNCLLNHEIWMIGGQRLTYFLATEKKGIYFGLLISAYKATPKESVKELILYLFEESLPDALNEGDDADTFLNKAYTNFCENQYNLRLKKGDTQLSLPGTVGYDFKKLLEWQKVKAIRLNELERLKK